MDALAQQGISLPAASSGFDNQEAGLGKLFPVSGGLKANIEFFTDRKLCVEKSGSTVYARLDEYAATPPEQRPDLFDVLNCEEGCVMGPGGSRAPNPFVLHQTMEGLRRQVLSADNAARHREVFQEYD